MAETGTKAVLNLEAIKADRERRVQLGVPVPRAGGSRDYGSQAVLTADQKVALQEGDKDRSRSKQSARIASDRESEINRAVEARVAELARSSNPKDRRRAMNAKQGAPVGMLGAEEGDSPTRANRRIYEKILAEEKTKVIEKYRAQEIAEAKDTIAEAQKKPTSAESMARAEAESTVNDREAAIIAAADKLKKAGDPHSKLKDKLESITKNRKDHVDVEAQKILEKDSKKKREGDEKPLTPEQAQKMAEKLVDEKADALAALVNDRDRQVFREQSYLISILDTLSKKRMTGLPKFQHIVSLSSADPAAVTSLLYAFKGLELLNDLTPAQTALMVPYITVSILEYGSRTEMINGNPLEIPVPLQGLWLREDIFARDPSSRGRNIGLKSFSWSPAGGNPFTAMSPLTAEMVLYGDSLTVFQENPYNTLLVPGAGTGVQSELKIVVGWSVPSDGAGIMPASLVSAINEARTTLFCTAVGQKFDFKDDGSFNLTLSYKARIASALKGIDLLDLRTKRVKAQERQRRINTGLFDKFNKHAAKKISNPKYAVPLIPDFVASNFGLFEGDRGKGLSYYENLSQMTDKRLEQKSMADVRKGSRNAQDHATLRRRNTVRLKRIKVEFLKYKRAKAQWEAAATAAAAARRDATWQSLGFNEAAIDDFVKSMGGTESEQAAAKIALTTEMEKAKTPFSTVKNKGGKPGVNTDVFGGIAQDIVSNVAEQRTSTAYQRFINILEDLYGKDKSAILNLTVDKNQIEEYFKKYGGSKTGGSFKTDVRKAAEAVLPEEKQKLLEKGKTKNKGTGPAKKIGIQSTPPSTTAVVPSGTGQTFKQVIKAEDLGDGRLAIPFFFFGDLVDAIMKMAAPAVSEERIRLVLGSMRFMNYFTKKASIVPLANIPISVRRYNAWIHDTFVKTVKRITLDEFLAKAIKSLIAPAFGEEAFSNVPPLGADSPNRCSFSYVGGPASAKKKIPPGTATAESIVGALHNPGYKGSSMNFILVTSDMTSGGHSGGNMAVDASRGIPHIYLGANAGLIKTATFNKVTLAGYREDRMVRGGKSGLSAVREPYNVDITTVGNTIFKPGVQFFLLPTLPGSSGLQVAQQVGLGGYFTVLSTDNIIQPGKFETIVKAQFEAFADGLGSAKASKTKATNTQKPTVKNLSEDTPEKKKSPKAIDPKLLRAKGESRLMTPIAP